MFQFMQEPSSGSIPVLSWNYKVWFFSVFLGIDTVNVMVVYQPYFVVLAKHRTAPWWWFLREPKHVRASVINLYCFNFLWFYNSVHQLEQ